MSFPARPDIRSLVGVPRSVSDFAVPTMVAASAPGSTATEATDAMQMMCHAFMADRWRRAHLKRNVLAVTGWDAHVAREVARYEDGAARLPVDRRTPTTGSGS